MIVGFSLLLLGGVGAFPLPRSGEGGRAATGRGSGRPGATGAGYGLVRAAKAGYRTPAMSFLSLLRRDRDVLITDAVSLALCIASTIRWPGPARA